MACCNFNGCRRCSPENYDDIEDVIETHPQFLIKELEEKLKGAVEAAFAYQKLSMCYRLGKNPTEKLFKELEKAGKTLEKYKKIKVK